MTINEASERYNIPIKILQEYESWGLCGEVKKIMGSWRYDESDIERLSVIMTLHDIGFTNEEVKKYMQETNDINKVFKGVLNSIDILSLYQLREICKLYFHNYIDKLSKNSNFKRVVMYIDYMENFN